MARVSAFVRSKLLRCCEYERARICARVQAWRRILDSRAHVHRVVIRAVLRRGFGIELERACERCVRELGEVGLVRMPCGGAEQLDADVLLRWRMQRVSRRTRAVATRQL